MSSSSRRIGHRRAAASRPRPRSCRRAVALTGDATRRADRALAAAQANLAAGAFGEARSLLAAAEAGPLDELARARVDLLRAEVAFAHDRGGDAPLLLLQAARQLETLDLRLSRDTYLEAWAAALFAGRLARAGGSLLEVSRAVATAPAVADPLPCDLLSDGLALVFTDGRPAAVPVLTRAVAAFASTEVSAEQLLRWGWLASRAASMIWDYDRCLEIGARAVQLARDSGALEALAVVDNACGQAAASGGDFATAELLIAEVDALKEATGTRIPPHAAIALAGIRGREESASELIDGAVARRHRRRPGNRPPVREVGAQRADERSRPLRRGARGGCGGMRARTAGPHRFMGAERADRGRRQNRAC